MEFDDRSPIDTRVLLGRFQIRPLGVWGVIAPFNFPIALAGGPASAAILTGNTVVFKPGTATPYAGLALYEILAKVLPPSVFNHVAGGRGTVGQEIVARCPAGGGPAVCPNTDATSARIASGSRRLLIR